jgi:murein L,D-transpeptidase YafK
MIRSAVILITLIAPGNDFAERQTHAPRVQQARSEKMTAIGQLFAAAKIAYPPAQMLLRVIKDEDVLELWAGAAGTRLSLLKSYAICARSGGLGPKRQQGDLQVPEGFYHVDRFNAWSRFFLSLGINYPNRSDRILGVKGRLGGDIFIHGDCVTIGCVPIETEPIKELYVMALDTHLAGHAVHVHIFPARLDADRDLVALAGGDASLVAFWRQLQAGWQAFESQRRLPVVNVDPDSGVYQML